jgi:WD40 repeat protein
MAGASVVFSGRAVKGRSPCGDPTRRVYLPQTGRVRSGNMSANVGEERPSAGFNGAPDVAGAPHETLPFVRHRGPVTAVAAVPGSSLVVTSGYDGAVGLFDLATQEVELLGYHRHLVNDVAVNAAGTTVASSSSDYTVKLWDLATRRAIQVLRGHYDDVNAFAFVDDSTGASAGHSRQVIVWDLKTGRIREVFDDHEKDVLSITCHEGRVFTSGDDMTLREWDVAAGRPAKVWGPFETETDSCAIDPLHRRAVLGCDDGVIRLFDIETGGPVGEIAAHASGIKRVAISPATGDILSAAYDQRMRVWRAEDLTERVELDGRQGVWERSIAWSPDGAHVLAGTFDGTLVQWDGATGACLLEVGEPVPARGNPCFNDVAASGGDDVALVSDDGRVRVAQLAPGHGAWVARGEPASGPVLMNAVAWDGATGRVLCGAHDHKLHEFTRDDGLLAHSGELALGEGPINTIAVASHLGLEGVAFVGCYSGAVVKLGPAEERLGTFRLHENAVKSLALHPALPLGVSGSADGAVVSWDLDGRLLDRFVGHMSIVDDVDIDPAGRCLASTGRDFTLKVFDLASGRLLHSVALGRRSPKALCFFDEDTVIVTSYWGELLRVTLHDEQVLRRQVAGNGISSAARHGDHVVVTSYDGCVYLVRPSDLEPVQVMRAMHQRVDRRDDAG